MSLQNFFGEFKAWSIDNIFGEGSAMLNVHFMNRQELRDSVFSTFTLATLGIRGHCDTHMHYDYTYPIYP